MYQVSFNSSPSYPSYFVRAFPVKTPEGKGWERSSMRILSGFEMICFPSVYGNDLWQLCIAGIGVWDGLSWAKKVLLLGQYTMASQEKRQNPYEIELPQSIIDSFARFLAPEIQKLYASEEGRKELETWKKKYFDKSEEWSKVQR